MKKNVFWVGGIIILGIVVALVLFFSLKQATYEVSFISDGEKILDTIKVKKDGTIEEPNEPTREGYDFIGWYNGTEKFDFSTKITKDIKLVAKWEKGDLENIKPTTTKVVDTTKTTKKKTTKKKTTTSTISTTKPTETTKPIETTSAKKDVISWTLKEVEGSDVGQATLYLIKNGVYVSGTCTIVTKTGETVDNFEINASGYTTNSGFIKDVKNIKIN